ncbi:MAG TPA: hypothetical protein VKR52_14220 [Terracidiphilus sp.]|nr:hypothetical protein [Terracidiphilus sp.]
MGLMRLLTAGLVSALMMAVLLQDASAASQWDEPAAALAGQIADILGPGQVRFTLRNASSIGNDDVPVIRRLLEQDLKSHGITVAGSESANAIRITLSENVRERLWVAEVVEGTETQVTMVHLDLAGAQSAQQASGMVLRSQQLFSTREPILSVLVAPGALIVLEPEQFVIYDHSGKTWREQRRVLIGQKRPLPRDPRGIIIPNNDLISFQAWLAGTECTGNDTAQDAGSWSIHCQESDDPWPIAAGADGNTPARISAFYNGARDYFTGVLAPNAGVDLPAFYTSAVIPRPAGGGAILVNGIDGKMQLLDTASSRAQPVAGTRDWGSDFAALNSGCGAGTQVIASGSGEAATDSLRAYEIPALEAVPASPPLAVNGAVTAMWPAPDNKSVFAVVRNTAAHAYEVDRVTAVCN